MDTIKLVIKEIPNYELFRLGTGGSLIALLSQLIHNPNFMLTTLATLSGIAVAGLSAYKVWLEIAIKRKELQELNNKFSHNQTENDEGK